MSSRILPLLVAASAISFIAGCSSNVHDGVNMKKKVGFGAVVPSTGPYRQVGSEYFRGMSVAEHALNDTGGVEDKQVKVIVYDSAGEPEKGLDGVRRLTRDFDMDYIAVALPRVNDKVAHELEDHGTVVCRLDGGTPAPEQSRFTLRPFVSGKDEAKLMTDTLAKEGARKVLVLAVEDRYGNEAGDLSVKAARANGATLVDRIPLRNEPETLVEITAASLKNGYDAVLVFGHGPELPPALLALRKGAHKGSILGNHAFAGKTVTLLEPALLKGVRFTAPEFCTRTDRPMANRFRDEYRSMNRAEPDLFSALGYDQVLLVFSAVKAEETTKPKSVYQHVLADKTFDGAAGTYRFDDAGDARLELALAEVLSAGKSAAGTQK